MSNHLGAENVFHGGKCQICGSHLCSLTQWYSACLQKVRFWIQHLNNTKLIKSTRGLGTKDSFSHQLPAQMKAGDQLCMWHVCPAALRAVLWKVLSKGTALKLNCSSKRNESLNLNDGKKKQTGKGYCKRRRKGMRFYLKWLPQRTLVLAFGRTKGHCKEIQKGASIQNILQSTLKS